MVNKSLTVGEVAELLGVTTTTLRNWDKSGKLVPNRDPDNKYRVYSIKDVKNVLEENGVLYLPFTELEKKVENNDLNSKSIKSLIRRMSAAFRNSSGGGLMERFEEITKLLFTKIHDEKLGKEDAGYLSLFEFTESITYKKLNDLYSLAVKKFDNLLLNGRGELGDDQKAIIESAKILSKYTLSKAELDVKGVAYEELIKNTFEKTENQQFFTPRQVVEFIVGLMRKKNFRDICDPACGSAGFLIEVLKLGIDPSAIRGFEVDKRMAWVAQMNLEIHDGSGAAVTYIENDGSLGINENLLKHIPKDGFDLIITNPPFGSDFNNIEALSKFRLGMGKSNRRRGILFVERCIDWLAEGTGYLAIILDDSVLNGSANEDVRKLMLEKCELEAVISLPESAFKPYASVETSIILLRKRSGKKDTRQSSVFMAKANNVGRKANGDPLMKRTESGKMILDNDLSDVLKAWEIYKTGEDLIDFDNEAIFICDTDRFQKNTSTSNRIDFLFHHPSREKAEKALNNSQYPIFKLSELVTQRNDSLVPNIIDPLSTWRYVGLAQIQSSTGGYDVIEVFGNQIKSSVKRFKYSDVVFSKLRPELRKVFVATEEEDAYASSECFVFNLKDTERLDKRYLVLLLRSDVVYGQIVYQISGTGRPRIGPTALLNVRIPLPPIAEQEKIVKSYEKAYSQYLNHKELSALEIQKANSVLQKAQCNIREQIC